MIRLTQLLVASVIFAQEVVEEDLDDYEFDDLEDNIWLPTPPDEETDPSVFLGYYGNWYQWRKGGMKFTVPDIQAEKITHINFAFAMVGSKDYDGGAYSIRHFEDNDLDQWGRKGAYAQLRDIKAQYPHIKTLISVGGWSFNSPDEEDPESAKRMRRLDPGWHYKLFSEMASTKPNRKLFIDSCLKFADDHGFDGIDLDWEYPGVKERGGVPKDKKNFVRLLREFRKAINAKAGVNADGSRLLFTIAAGVGPWTVDKAYDIPKISKYLDFINLMTYDLYGGWDLNNGTRIHSQLHAVGDGEFLSGAWAVNDWVSKGAPRKKLTLGWATYSRSFNLKSSTSGQGIGSSAAGFGDPQRISNFKGTAAYYEIVDLINKGAVETHDSERCAAYLQKGLLWMGYDDVKSMKCKADFIKDEGLLGGFMWDLAEDDFKRGSPLISAFSKHIGLPKTLLPPTPTPAPTPAPRKEYYTPTWKWTPIGNPCTCKVAHYETSWTSREQCVEAFRNGNAKGRKACNPDASEDFVDEEEEEEEEEEEDSVVL